MRDKKLVAVCILALVMFAFVQGLPEAPQHESMSIHPSENIYVFSGQNPDVNPCGGGGGDEGGGVSPR